MTSSGYGTAQTLVSFTYADGYPISSLVSDSAGDLFGTTDNGGAEGAGTAFEIQKTSSGYELQTLVTFDLSNGAFPFGGLTSDSAGDLFGTTNGHSADGLGNEYGTVFEIAKTPSGYGQMQILWSFNDSDGSQPSSGLISDSAGDLFGTTYSGGASGDGTVFEIPKTASGYGQLQQLWSFSGFYGSDGSQPYGGLVSDGNGDLFGTTAYGGANNAGIVFEIPKTSSGYGSLKTLWSFNSSDGAAPEASLIIDGGGNLFGTTVQGGEHNDGTVFEIPKASTGYASLQTLLSFNGSNGAHPYGDLFGDGAGDLFGTTDQGGPGGNGTVFEIANVFTPIPTVDSTTTVTNSDQATTTESAIADSAVTTGTDGKNYINQANFNDGSTTLTGTADPGDTVTVSVNGGTGQAAAVAADGSWSFTLTGLADGQGYSAVATATGPAGGTASSPTYAFTVDASTSESAIADSAVTTGTDGQSYIKGQNFNGGATTLTGATEAGDTVMVSVNGGPGQAATMASDGSWSFTLTGLTDGTSYSVAATATDPAGNTAESAPLSFITDATAPTVRYLLINPMTGLSTGGGVSVNVNTFTAGGIAMDRQPGTRVEVFATLNGSSSAVSIGAGTVDSVGNFRIPTQPLADGEYTFSIVATDVAGNVTTSVGPYGVTIDTQAPSAPTLSDASIVNGYVNAANDTATQTLSGTAEAGSAVNIYLNGSTSPAFTTTADGSGNWSVTLGTLANGSYSYTATATDAAGNVSVAGGPFAFTVDTTPPPQPAIAAAALSGGAWKLTGTAAAGSTVSVYDGATRLGTATASPTGAWSFPTHENNSAVRDFVAMLTDPAGNSSASPAWFEGTSGADVFSFGSEAALASAATILGNAGSDTILMTAPTTLADADFAHSHSIMTLALAGASTVAFGASAAAAGIKAVTTGNGATSIADTNTGTLNVNASALAAGALLTLSGSEKFTVTGLQANLVATNETGALNVTTAASSALSIATGAGSDTIIASAMTQGETLTLTGSHAATVTVGGDLAAGAYTGKLTVTASGTAAHTITTGSGADSITAANGGDTIVAGGGADAINVSGHSLADSFVYKSISDSPNASGHDTITGFAAGTGTGAVNDMLDFSAILGPTYGVQALSSTKTAVNPESIAWIYNASANHTLVYVNATGAALAQSSNQLMEVALAGNIHLAAANLIG